VTLYVVDRCYFSLQVSYNRASKLCSAGYTYDVQARRK
jgi:hypothetical protein